MKISELLAFVDSVKPNAFPASSKVAWLNEVEGMVWCDVMLLSPLEFKAYTYDESTGEGDCELLVYAPHNKLYNVYLSAMIDFYNGEYDKYQNSITMFNSHFGEYMRWYAMHYRPADGEFKYMGEYITAYGIAVKHGFEGTEEEWLESLRGTVDEEMVKEFIEDYLEENPIPAPVTSVNGKTGAVELSAEDVGALPESTSIPANTSDLKNDSGFITKAVADLLNYYTKDETLSKDEINAKISAIPKFAISVVSSLPTSNISTTTIYLVGGGEGDDLYTEYVYTGGKWEILGSQKVDLTGYATETWVNTQLSSYIKSSELDAAISAALAEAKASGEFDGADGADGVSVTSVEQTTTSTADGGTNVITVTLSNGQAFQFNVKNGSKGSTGEQGIQGEKGADGAKGEKGDKGDTGSAGEDGNGIASAVLNSDYTLTLTFTDGTSYTTPSIRGAAGAAGDKGADGTSVTITSTRHSNGVTIITFSDGTVVNIPDGLQGTSGINGADGTDGVSVTSVEQTTTSTADGGTNVITVTLSNGQAFQFNVKNGSKGSQGEQGENGEKGDTGDKGDSVTVTSVSESSEDGGENVVTFSDGKTVTIKNGSKGSTGDKGENGEDGYSIHYATVSADPDGNYECAGDPADIKIGDLILDDDGSGNIYQVTTSEVSPILCTLLYSIKGDKGATGADGTSVTVSKVTESTASGGTNVVTFSDGSTLNVKNGTDGADGAKGDKGDTGPAYTLTSSDKTAIATEVKNSLPTLTMTGTDEDGATHTWTIYGS